MRPSFHVIIRLGLGLLAPGLTAGPMAAQATDTGTLLVRARDRDVGTETFSVTTTAKGIKLTSHVVYNGPRPAPELTASLDRASGEEFAFQLESRGAVSGRQTYAVQKRNRLTVRRVARGADQATELPGGATLIILADSVFAPYLQAAALATEAGSALTAVVLPEARRVVFTARRSPTATGSLIRLTGEVEAEIHLGTNGELLSISVPSLGLEAVRAPN
ncbi:MAG: hypothetical protein ABI587_02885 [Gemmatimonadales bacterium]